MRGMAGYHRANVCVTALQQYLAAFFCLNSDFGLSITASFSDVH
jgi:hypothetical protein